MKPRKPLILRKRQIAAGIKVPSDSREIPVRQFKKEVNYVRHSRKAAIITHNGKALGVMLPLPE